MIISHHQVFYLGARHSKSPDSMSPTNGARLAYSSPLLLLDMADAPPPSPTDICVTNAGLVVAASLFPSDPADPSDGVASACCCGCRGDAAVMWYTGFWKDRGSSPVLRCHWPSSRPSLGEQSCRSTRDRLRLSLVSSSPRPPLVCSNAASFSLGSE